MTSTQQYLWAARGEGWEKVGALDDNEVAAIGPDLTLLRDYIITRAGLKPSLEDISRIVREFLSGPMKEYDFDSQNE